MKRTKQKGPISIVLWAHLLAACGPAKQAAAPAETAQADSHLDGHGAARESSANSTSALQQQSATVQQAVRDGCYTGAQLVAMFKTVSFSGSTTEREADQNLRTPGLLGLTTTKQQVGATTWVYRAYESANTDNWHVQELKRGYLWSKQQHQVDIGRANWGINGPQLSISNVSEPRNPTALGMRILAIKSSDTPKSQFVSVALTYEVASGFGSAVYAFQVRPNSEVLGLKDCQLGSGEDQLQIFGGTKISNLHRKVRGGVWTKYLNGQWVPISGPFPPS